MWKQIGLLTGVQLRNLWGWNQIKYSKDKKEKNRLIYLIVAYILLVVVMGGYAGMFSYGCVIMGMGKVIPAYVLAIVSLVILFFTIFKAGNVLFESNSYEMMMSLPVPPDAIIVSRFLNMYVQNLGVGLMVILPAVGVYAFYERPGIYFYVTMLCGVLLMPFLPMTIATAIGAAVTAVSSRMKHKNLVTIILTVLLTVGITVLSIAGPFAASNALGGENADAAVLETIMQNLAEVVEQQIFGIYPPARFFTEGVVGGKIGSFFMFAGISILPFILTVWLVRRKFLAICTALHARSTAGNYKMQSLVRSSVLKTLVKKELKGYFSSATYVMNTSIGYILMVLLAAGVLVVGPDKMEQGMGIPGLVTKAMPLVLAWMCSISPTTASAISMEGKKWWIVRSLPVTARQLLDSKLLVNLIIALPCYAVAEVILLLSIKGSWTELCWLVLVPLVYLVFMSVLGITVNCKMPFFNWDNDTAVVKQSGAVLVTMMTGMAVSILPMVLIFVLPQVSVHLVMGGTVVLLMAVTAVLYRRNMKIDLRDVY